MNIIPQYMFEVLDGAKNQFFAIARKPEDALDLVRKSSFAKKPEEVLVVASQKALNKDWDVKEM